MQDESQGVTPQTVHIVADIDEAMGTRKRATRPGAAPRQAVAASPTAGAKIDSTAADDNGAIAGLADALNRRIFTWASPYNESVIVRFRRPKAGTDEMISRMLGEHANNQALVRRYKALASIMEICGEAIPDTIKNTIAKISVIRDRLGFVRDGEESYDEPINSFVFAYECAMYPEQVQMLAELEQSGLLPDDVKRIVAASGLEQAKK